MTRRCCIYSSAHERLADSPYSVAYQCWAAEQYAITLESLGHHQLAGKVKLKVSDLYVRTIVSGDYQPHEQRVLLSHITWKFNNISTKLFQQLYDQIAAHEDVDPWLLDIMKGWLHINLAWQFRGSEWASEVTDQGWDGFAKHMAAAREALMSAWVLDPDAPEAATQVSSPGEFHPQALPEPYVNVSAHTAPIIPSPYGTIPSRQ